MSIREAHGGVRARALCGPQVPRHTPLDEFVDLSWHLHAVQDASSSYSLKVVHCSRPSAGRQRPRLPTLLRVRRARARAVGRPAGCCGRVRARAAGAWRPAARADRVSSRFGTAGFGCCGGHSNCDRLRVRGTPRPPRGSSEGRVDARVVCALLRFSPPTTTLEEFILILKASRERERIMVHLEIE